MYDPDVPRKSAVASSCAGQSPGPVEPSQGVSVRQQLHIPCGDRKSAVKYITYSPLGPGTTSGSCENT
eukprot:m.497249 g.497249  ORF g.497249 m.497249 type:complete len:68 (+) comp21815_c1_seq8:1754-1957(+)